MNNLGNNFLEMLVKQEPELKGSFERAELESIVC